MRVGVDARTGQLIAGWDHVCGCIEKCLTTRINTRVLRRHLGSYVPELQDQNADAMTIFKVYISIAEALADPDGGEPGFALKTVEMVEAGRSGRFVFLLEGTYYPRGHLGDFTVTENRSVSYDAGVLVT